MSRDCDFNRFGNLACIVSCSGLYPQEWNPGGRKRFVQENIPSLTTSKLVRTVVEFYGQKNICRPKIAQHEVKVLPRNQVSKACFPSRIPARDEIGEADFEGDEVAASDRHSKGEVKSGFATAQKSASRFIR